VAEQGSWRERGAASPLEAGAVKTKGVERREWVGTGESVLVVPLSRSLLRVTPLSHTFPFSFVPKWN
jgi:hypothetical protein